ncbi:MAG TPA: rRNA maturation RNase YbeY [Gemmatimonadaceae bacterium]|nr:rRNA maturation RNase YbeY [Gemmatimonadaceae bacterium]
MSRRPGAAPGRIPSVAVDVTADATRVPIARARVIELVRGVLRAERISSALVSVTFVTPRAIAALNRRHLGHRGSTDVISFGMRDAGGPVVGDIYIAPAVARDNARRHGVGVREEVARLVVHGTLHVAGWEHPEDETRTSSPMWRRQEMLLRRLLAGGAR